MAHTCIEVFFLLLLQIHICAGYSQCPSGFQCNDTYSVCQENKCICKDGDFSDAVSCSGLKDLLMFCSFELSTCPFIQDKTDDTDWTSKQGATPSIATGPNMAFHGQRYMYLEATSLSSGSTAILTYTYPNSTFSTCFRFHYHMYGTDMGTLKIIRERASMNNYTIFTKTGDQCNEWKTGSLQIDKKTSKIFIEATRGSDYKSDIAIDLLTIQEGVCECPDWFYGDPCKECDCTRDTTIHCDKDTGHCHCQPGWTGTKCDCRETAVSGDYYCSCRSDVYFCRQNLIMLCSFESINCPFIQDKSDVCDWSLREGETPSSDTGPEGAIEGHKYMYIETSSPREPGDNAILIYMYPYSSTSNCFQFKYHMYGRGMGTLNIRRKQGESGNLEIMFTKSGNQGSEWKKGSFMVPPNTTKIFIEAVRGSNFTSDIAIDEISLQKGACKCPDWLYGTGCTQKCQCNKFNTALCDKATGLCHCKPGWRGDNCDCRDTVACDDTYSFCQNDVCMCKDGNFPYAVNCSGLNNVLMFCSFESTTCPFVQDTTDSGNWRLKTGETDSDGTGPKKAKDGQRYMYLEASHRNSGYNVSMTYNYPSSDYSTCFQFSYHMYGINMGSLEISRENIQFGGKITMFTRTGNQCNKWKKGSFVVPPGTSKIFIKAIRGSDYQSDIAIDNIYIQKGSCETAKTDIPSVYHIVHTPACTSWQWFEVASSTIFLISFSQNATVCFRSVFSIEVTNSYSGKLNCSITSTPETAGIVTTFCFYNITKADSGMYSIKTANKQTNGIIYVMDKPTVPKIYPTTTVEGHQLTLACASSSTSTPFPTGQTMLYTWTINDTTVSDTRFTVSGNTMTIGSVRREDKDILIKCTAEETQGLSATTGIFLTVNYPPQGKPVMSYTKMAYVSGSTTTLSCNITEDGNPPASWTWRCGNRTVYSGIRNSLGRSKLTFVVTMTDNNQPCTCTASSSLGQYNQTSDPVWLDITTPTNEDVGLIAAIAGSTACIIVVIATVLFLFLFRRKRNKPQGRRNKNEMTCEMTHNPSAVPNTHKGQCRNTQSASRAEHVHTYEMVEENVHTSNIYEVVQESTRTASSKGNDHTYMFEDNAQDSDYYENYMKDDAVYANTLF